MSKKTKTVAFDRASVRLYDTNDWFVVERNPLSRVGIFDYLGSSIGADEPDRMYRVYRPASALSDPEFLESLKLLPFVEDHEMLGEGFSDAAEYGVGGVIGQNVVFENDTVYGNVRVFSEAMAKRISSGKKELSLGYRCRYELTKGTYNGQEYDAIQTALRGNHVALVENGRMGSEIAVLDAADRLYSVVTLDAKDKREMAKAIEKHRKNRAFAQFRKSLTSAFDSLEKSLDEDDDGKKPEGLDEDDDAKKAEDEDDDDDDAKKTGDEDDGAKKAEDEDDDDAKKAEDEDDDDAKKTGDEDDDAKKAEDEDDDKKTNGMDAAALRSEVRKLRKEVRGLRSRPALDSRDVFVEAAARDGLAKRLAPHIGTFDHAAMTTSEVAAYGCKKLGLKATAANAMDKLDGYLAAAKLPSPANPQTGMDSAEPSSGLSKWAAGA